MENGKYIPRELLIADDDGMVEKEVQVVERVGGSVQILEGSFDLEVPLDFTFGDPTDEQQAVATAEGMPEFSAQQ